VLTLLLFEFKVSNLTNWRSKHIHIALPRKQRVLKGRSNGQLLLPLLIFSYIFIRKKIREKIGFVWLDRRKMVESKRSYEECRKQRLEENKKRMEELNIGKLALALKASSPNSSPVKFIIITLSLSLSLCFYFIYFIKLFCTDRQSK
jgi:hypothetical protein